MAGKIGWFLEHLATAGDTPALICDDEITTYDALSAEIVAWRSRLDAHGIGPGDVVALVSDYSPAGCAALLALFERHAVAVPFTGPTPEMERHLEIANAGVVITIPGGATGGEARLERRARAEIPALMADLRERDSPGLVLFSSGSSGDAKGIVHDAALLLERYRNPGQAWRTLIFLLFDHIGGVNTLFYTLRNHGTLVVLRNRSVHQVCDAIATHKVGLLPTTPSFLNLLLLDTSISDHDLSSLRMITYGTEVMPQATLDRALRALPEVRFRQTYGLSEVGICASRSKTDGSLWMTLGGSGYEYAVRGGTLWVRARTSMLGYLNAPSPFDADGWLDTGDLVEQDGEYLRILGRDSDLINVGGQKVYPAEVESVVLEVEGVLEAAVSGAPHLLLGHIVTARVRPADSDHDPIALRRQILLHCNSRLAPYKRPMKIFVVDQDLHTARFKTIRRLTPGETRPSEIKPSEINRFGVTLKRLGPDDLELVRGWRNDPKISQYMKFRGQISAEDQRRWFARIDNALNHYFVIVHRGDAIGLANIKDIDSPNRRGEYGIFIFDDERLNSLVPICVVMVLLDFAFDSLRLDVITGHILRDNPRAQRFNKAFGFELAEHQEAVENQLYTLTREDFADKGGWLRRTVLRGFGPE